jgi:hypothetical protein
MGFAWCRLLNCRICVIASIAASHLRCVLYLLPLRSILVDISWVASNRRDKERRRSLTIEEDAVVLYGSTSNVQQITSLLSER